MGSHGRNACGHGFKLASLGRSCGPRRFNHPRGSQSGGVFTGPFTFAYYINCTNGVSYNNSYTSNLDGTNNFAFYGAADGSLLLSINSGGMQLLSSCGDPYTGDSLAASYNVSKNTAPTPTPTPPPAPTPTPVPPGSGGSSGGTNSGSGSGSSSSSGGSSAGSHNQTTHPVRNHWGQHVDIARGTVKPNR